MTLQKLSSNLALIVPKRDDSKEKIDKDIEHLKMAVPDAWERLFNNSGHMTSDANQEFCGKWKVLKKLLRFWYGNGDKVLIFSHSVRLLKMLHVLFTRDENNYNVSYLDGSLSYVDRAAVVDDFNANPGQFVFLISTRAGGVGLNITSANKVVVMDPNWNPAHDLQAQDRAYRIGQLRDVEVFRLISIGTIEEIVYARQIYKQQQANIGYTASSERRYFTGVQDNKDKKGEIFGLNNLFRYQGDGVVLQDIVNKTNVAESRMGVAVADIDLSHISSDDGDALGDEESVMRNIDALIEEGGGDRAKSIQKINPIAAILSSVGVKYTHENSEVIGTSKTEARISRKAAENTTITGPDSRPVFEYSELRTGGVQYKYNPTEDVRRRQFCTMAKMFGIANATEFALLVEGWTQEQRRNCLEKFYRMRREALLGDSGTSGDASGLSTHGLVRVAAMEMKDELANFNGYNTTTIVKDHNDDDMTDDEL
jgi:superfamily II DNA/RNA helicase